MMAAADYALCEVCGGKTFYDAYVDYEVPNFGAQLVLCSTCAATHALKVVKR